MQPPTAAAASLISPLHPQDNVCSQQWVGAGSQSWSPQTPQPLPGLPHAATLPSRSLIPRTGFCWTTVQPLSDGNCREQPPSDAGKSPASPPKETPAFQLNPTVPAARPMTSSTASLPKAPQNHLARLPFPTSFQTQTRTCHAVKPTRAQAVPSTGSQHTSPWPRSSQQQQTHV